MRAVTSARQRAMASAPALASPRISTPLPGNRIDAAARPRHCIRRSIAAAVSPGAGIDRAVAEEDDMVGIEAAGRRQCGSFPDRSRPHARPASAGKPVVAVGGKPRAAPQDRPAAPRGGARQQAGDARSAATPPRRRSRRRRPARDCRGSGRRSPAAAARQCLAPAAGPAAHRARRLQ